MTSDESELLLLLSRMMLQTRTHAMPLFDPGLDQGLRTLTEKIRAARYDAADEEKHLARG
jgi:hypothetical protein